MFVFKYQFNKSLWLKLKTLSRYVRVRLLKGNCILDSNLMLMFFQVNIVVMSFLTNILIDGIGENCTGGEGALNQTLTKIFMDPGGVFSFCQSYPTLRCFISPPNIRNRPYWYPRFRPIILRALHHILLSRPINLQLLEDHQGELDPDGIHFNIMSGINFVQDLHDQAVQLVLQPPPDTSIRLDLKML